MTIIEKIKQSVEGATEIPFLYHAAGELNELIARCNTFPIAYSFLIDSGTIDDVNGRYHERVTLAVMFCDKTEFDFNALENEEIIDRMKVKAYKWLQSLRMSNTLRIVSVNSTQRLYDNTTDILTGFAVNITIEDVAGVGECELPDVVFEIKENGEYPVVGIDKVIVSVPNSLTDLVATENGKVYLPADYGVHGFGGVKTDIPKIKLSSFSIGNDCINDDGRWEGDTMVDTSVTSSFSFKGNDKVVKIDAREWDTANITKLGSIFESCKKLEEILGIENFNVSNVISMYKLFQYTYISRLDLSKWDVRNVTDFRYMMYGMRNLVWLDISNWTLHPNADIGGFFLYTRLFTTIVGDRTIDDVINNNIGVFIGLSKSIKLFGFEHSNVTLNRASLRALINGLADLTGQETQTLTLKEKLIAELTDEDIAIATNKNWTIV